MKRSLAVFLGLLLTLGVGTALAAPGVPDGYIPKEPTNMGAEYNPSNIDPGDILCGPRGMPGGAKENFACQWLFLTGNNWWKGVYDFDDLIFFDGGESCEPCFLIKGWLDIEVTLMKEIFLNRVYFHVGNMHGTTSAIGEPVLLDAYVAAVVRSNAPVWFGLRFDGAAVPEDTYFQFLERHPFPGLGPEPVEPPEINGRIPTLYAAAVGPGPVPPGENEFPGLAYVDATLSPFESALGIGLAAWWPIPEACDHWIVIRISVEVPYHKAHGRYYLEALLNVTPDVII
jgi:hypothetical protein